MSNDTLDPNNITLDDLTYFWMENGAPCFIANRWDVIDNICETIESFGFQIYYLITDKSTSKTVQVKNDKGLMVPTEVYSYTPAILKVVNNFTGRAIMDSQDAFGNSFCAVEETAEYKMPPIPRVIVDKLDEFFRLVDAQHKTESIVILTFDTTKEGSDGWGVLVPEQENTSVHCKYDADSIAALKPENVMIVGSVHSHPDMPAYASGTDHADQADFDGLHITYGWQKSVNNGATQYHLELQMGGTAFTLKPEDVFEDFVITKDPDPEVVQWSTKVKKVLPPYTGGSVTQAQRPQHQAQVAHNSQPTPPGTANFDRQAFLGNLSHVEKDAIIAMEYDTHTNPNSDCLMCTFPLTNADMASGFCMTCGTPIISSEMNHFDIIEFLHLYCVDQKIDPKVAYYVYCVDDSNTLNNFLINIKPDGQDPKDLGSEANSISPTPTDDEYETQYTLCCHIPVTLIDECSCAVTVLEDNVFHFDTAHKNVDIYSRDSSCMDCDHYYQVSCPSFSKAIVNFMTNGEMVSEQFTTCQVFINYKDRQDDFAYHNYGGYYD